MSATVTVEGLDVLVRKCRDPQLVGGPVHTYMQKAVLVTKAAVMPHVPRDQAHLQRSITTRASATEGIVGTNVPYAVFVHMGTRPHWPPVEAIRGWAERHGLNPFAVAHGIAMHGTKARPFFDLGFKDALPKLEGGLLKELAQDIEGRWGR